VTQTDPDLRDRIADALLTTRRADYADLGVKANHREHRFDARCALCTYDVDALADAVMAELRRLAGEAQQDKPAVDRAAVYAEVADRLAADAERGDKEGLMRIYRRSAAKQVRAWADELARETQQEPTQDGEEPTWSDTCPHCKSWYTTSEPGAHEASCPKRPAAEQLTAVARSGQPETDPEARRG
jgi:hypothetical protein